VSESPNIYGYSILNGSTIGYAPDGNILYSNDGANGNWAYTYDDLNQLTKGACSANCPATTGVQYTYDRYGNRWQESVTGSGIQPSYTFNAYNHITGGGIVYDAAGNVTNDGFHVYFYDAENRIVQVDGTVGQCSSATACYVYDAEGHRVRATVSGQTRDFLYDLSGRTIDEFVPGGTYWLGTWLRGEAYAGGLHIATYANSTTEFDNSEWLSTFRVRSDVSGNILETCTSLPFGEDLTCTGAEVTPIHFTGKERDSESGNDYFGARYYTSTMGRFMTTDWADKPIDVPYADFGNPQSLNLYSYVKNNPTTTRDLDGHCTDPLSCGAEFAGIGTLIEPGGGTVVGAVVGGIVGGAVLYFGGQAIINGLQHPGNSGNNASPPPTAPTNVAQGTSGTTPTSIPQGTPASTSQQGAVDTSAAQMAGGPKAADAPGVTAGGQATDKYGNNLGPSGEPQVNQTNSNTREGARNGALNEGSGAVEHSNPAEGQPHFHPADKKGDKKPSSTHHNYPD
jgi:RHS repeat-associated protein